MPANIKQVAKAAGVGTTTVSVILNKPREAGRFSQQTIDHVKQVATELGYQPNQRARSFRGGRTQVIGLAVDYYGQDKSPLAEPFVGALTGGIQAALWKKDYNLLLVAGHANENSAEIGCGFIRQGRIDGLILLRPPSPALLKKNKDLKKRMVLIRPHSRSGLACIYGDDAAGAELAVAEFARRGHRKLAWVGPREWFDESPNRRAEAFAAAGATRSLSTSMQNFTSANSPKSYLTPGVLSHAARTATTKLLKLKPPPTGILCYNAVCATGVYEAIDAAGLHIPNDIAVITFEEFASNFFAPHLSAISLRWPEVGARASERLLQNLASGDLKAKNAELIQPELFSGASL